MNAQIFSIIVNANKGSFASIETLTKVNIPQKWGLGKNVTKHTNKVVQVGYEYESAVNGRREAEGVEGAFIAEKLPWGEWLVPNRVITHKGKTYYRVYDVSNGVKAQTYYIDGVQATEEQLEVIKAFNESKAHTSRQGVENEVRPTNIEEGNILSIKCGKEYHKVEVTEVVTSNAK